MIALAWRQLIREPLRLLIAVAGVAFAVILIFMQLGFQTALYASGVRLHNRFSSQLFMVNPQSSHLNAMIPFSRRRLYQALGYPGVQAVSSLYMDLAGWKNPITRETRGILVVAFDPSDHVLDMPDVEVNRSMIQHPDVVLFDAASRPEFGPIAERFRAGHEVTAEVSRRRLKVVGLFDLGPSFGIDGNVITSDINFLRLFPKRRAGLIEVGLLWIKPGWDPKAVAETLHDSLPADVKILTKDELIAQEVEYWRHNTPIGYVFSFGVIMGFVVGTIIVYQILFADVSDHLTEYATLKAMGYTNRFLFGVVLAEAVTLAVGGFLPGLFVSWQAYQATENATGLPMRFTLPLMLSVLALTVFMCCLSGAITLRKVRSADPAEVF